MAGGRGLAACIIFATWMLTLRYLPLGLSAAFRLLGPLITFGAAVLFLQEQVSLFRLTALFGACVAGGLLLHTQLTNGLWHLAADAPRLAVLFPIAALFAIAAAHVAGKHLARTASPSAMTHSLLGICTLVFGLFTLPVWVWPQGAQWMLLGVMGLTEWAGQEALSRALSQTDLTLLVPMTLVRFVFMGLAGLLFFHEPVSVFFWGGSVLMACVVVAITRKST